MFRKRDARFVAAIVAVFFTWTLAGGANIAHAAKLASDQKGTSAASAKGKSAEDHFSGAIEGIGNVLSDSKLDSATKKKLLKSRHSEVKSLAVQIRREFADREAHLKKAKLPSEILERHRKFVAHFEENLAELSAELDALEAASTAENEEAAKKKLNKHLERIKAPSRHQPLDPNKLPHRSAEPVKREPRLKKEEFERAYGRDVATLPRPILVAALGDLTGLLPANETIVPGQPSIVDLAGTVDAPITPAISAKAAELEHDPVKIYNWVRNTIEFVPTWGSIQGAQMTMESKQGNAFDTSSLLIALLRASGIHARYVMGTVTLPIDKVMNWVGGFTDPMAALDFMSSGGIPTVALTNAGTVKEARFEHVWVEAWIDYFPSRGARHKAGQGDTWIPLDPSYKEYAYTEGLDLQASVPFDAQAFVEQLTASATIDEAQGYATGVDSLLVQQAMSDYQSEVEAYIAQQHPDATVGDVLGKKEIIVGDYPYLLGTLPYKTAVRGGAYALLPASLRHTLSFTVGSGSFDTEPLIFKQSLPELAGKKITLSYAPATSTDEAVIESYLPRPHVDGTPIQPEELPSSLPAYMIRVKPELRISDQVVAIGHPVTLGANENFSMDFSSPWISSERIENIVTVGAYHAIALNLSNITQKQIQNIKTRLENTKAKLEMKNFAHLTNDELIGDLLYTTALMYHAELGTTQMVAGKAAKVASVTWPSETIFKTDLTVDVIFGQPRSVSPGGMSMDADKLASVTAPLDGNQQKKIDYLLQTGIASSALEHSIPEKLFSTPENHAEGISAVKALKIANEQEVPIYTVTKENIDTVLPKIQLAPEIKNDIKNNVNAGKVVTASAADINFHGWVGCGYIVTDPINGSGAYMISGGLSGSKLMYAFWTVLWALAWVIAITAATVAAVIAPVAIAQLVAMIAPLIATLSELYTSAVLFLGAQFYSLPEVAIIVSQVYFSTQVGLTMTSILPGSVFEWLRLLITLRNALIFYYIKITEAIRGFNKNLYFEAGEHEQLC